MTLLFFLAASVAWFAFGMFIASELANKDHPRPLVIWALVEVVLIAVTVAL